MGGNASCASCNCDGGRKGELSVTQLGGGSYPHAAQRLEEFDDYGGDGSVSVDIEQAQNVVKNFVRCLVKGLPVTLLSVNGGTAECIAFLDRKLTTLALQRAAKPDAKKRPISLEEIAEVVVGECGGQDFNLRTDAMCVTLVLDSGQAVGFRFDNEEDRDTFALCLSMFIDGRRSEMGGMGGGLQVASPVNKV